MKLFTLLSNLQSGVSSSFTALQQSSAHCYRLQEVYNYQLIATEVPPKYT
jgi:hypothetical protein